MKAKLLFKRRIVLDEEAFAELVLWELAAPLPGSRHRYKYRLAYVVREVCVLRFDNESGKGDHVHVNNRETPYTFTTPDKLVADFQTRIERWNHENRDS